MSKHRALFYASLASRRYKPPAFFCRYLPSNAITPCAFVSPIRGGLQPGAGADSGSQLESSPDRRSSHCQNHCGRTSGHTGDTQCSGCPRADIFCEPGIVKCRPAQFKHRRDAGVHFPAGKVCRFPARGASELAFSPARLFEETSSRRFASIHPAFRESGHDSLDAYGGTRSH